MYVSKVVIQSAVDDASRLKAKVNVEHEHQLVKTTYHKDHSQRQMNSIPSKPVCSFSLHAFKLHHERL
jgi:hypothetical protein